MFKSPRFPRFPILFLQVLLATESINLNAYPDIDLWIQIDPYDKLLQQVHSAIISSCQVATVSNVGDAAVDFAALAVRSAEYRSRLTLRRETVESIRKSAVEITSLKDLTRTTPRNQKRISLCAYKGVSPIEFHYAHQFQSHPPQVIRVI